MKFHLVALLAGLCTTVVTAAPSTTPNFLFQKFEVFGDFGQKVEDYWVNLKCIRDVVTYVVHGTDMESLWHETSKQINHLVNVEWKKCLQIHDPVKNVKCKSDVIERGVGNVTVFVRRLIAAQKWDLLEKIKLNVISQCLGGKGTPFEVEDEFEDSLPVQFECLVNVLGQVSKSHSLQDLWSKSEPQLKHHIGKLKQCDSAGHPLLVLLCNVKEGVSTIVLASEYIRLATAQDPTFIQDFVVQYRKTCGGKSDTDLLTDMFGVEGVEECVQKIGEKIKCISDAISDAVKDTDYNAIWKEYEKDMVKLQKHLKACKNEPTTWEAAKCISNELKFSHQILSKFFTNLKKANVNAYTKVKENIRNRCYE